MQLEEAQAAAVEGGRGLWAPDACGAPVVAAIAIDGIRYDATGNDNENLNDEWIELRNAGAEPLDLSGWLVKDESASHRFRFPDGFVLAVGGVVRLHTGCGIATGSTLYWCNSGSAVWNNSGDTAFVLDPAGNIVVSESY